MQINYKILIRNLRERKNERLDISTVSADIRFEKTSESVRVSKESESRYRKR